MTQAQGQPSSVAPASSAPLLAGQMIPVYPGTLSPQTAVALAIARHPEIRGAEATIARQQAQVALAQAGRWPVIQYGLGPGYGGSYGSGGNQAAVRGNISINQPVWDFGATRNRIEAAKDQEAAARSSRADTVERVAQATLSAYVSAAVAQERLVVARETIEVMRGVAERITQRQRAGLSDRSDGNAAGISVIRAEVESENARTAADTALSQLIELIGVSPTALAPLQESFAMMVATTERRTPNFDAAPAVQAAISALAAADANEKSARAERWPALGLGASRTYSTGNYSANDATWIGLSLNGNFSLGGAGRQRVAAAVAEREAARQTLEARRLELRTAWAVAVRQEEGARQRLADIKNVSTLWLTTRDLYWQEYILDKRGLNDELNAEREVYASRVEEMNVTGEAISAAVRALVVEGRLLGLLQAQPALSQEPALGIPVDRTVVTQAAVAPAVTALVADAVSGGGAQVQAPAPAQSAAAEVPTPVRVVAAAPVGRGAWEVQLGIFSRDDQARAAWAALSAQPVLAGRNASFVSSGPFTRLLAGPFDSEAAATAVCTALQATGHEACAVQSLIGEVVREALPVAVMASPEPEAVAIPVAPLRPEVTTFALPPPAEPLAEPAPARQVVVVRGPSTAPQWNIQLGMFSVSDQANATWEALKAEPALRGWTATFVHSGPFTRLLAGPVSSEGEATAACAALQAAGHDACVALVNE